MTGRGRQPTDFDLGSGHWARFVAWAPDRQLNPQWAGVPDVDRWGLIVGHTHPDGEVCEGSLTFDGPVQRQVEPDRPNRWTVEAWDPLTLSPSILRRECGDHGFIRAGRWVPA